MGSKYTAEVKELACRLRQELVPISMIVKQIGACKKSIERWTKEHKPNQIVHPLYKTQSIIHDYFSKENIDKHPERLVIIGFIAADGCVSDHNPGQARLEFNLSQKDRCVLEKLNLELSLGKRHISLNTTTISNSLYFPSDQMFSDLSKFGIVPRKTQTFNLPDLSIEDMQYFLRGYFYGDGCVHDYGKNIVYHLVSTTAFSLSLKEFMIFNKIVEYCGSYPLKKHPGYSQTLFQNRHAQGFSDFIFANDKMNLLPRKHKTVDDLKLLRKPLQAIADISV